MADPGNADPAILGDAHPAMLVDAYPAMLRRLWMELLPGAEPTLDSDFFQSGGHSLLATRLLARVERDSGVKIALAGFFSNPTFGGLVAAVAADPPARLFRFDRVARLGTGTAKPVFAVLHSNGAFFPLGHAVGPDHPFVALQTADRRAGGRLPGTIQAIAETYVRQLRTVEPEGPYVLLGWCLAGNVAYEAAQQLHAAGQRVSAVVMVDTWNPAYFARMGRLRRQVAERSYGWQIILTEFAKVLRGRLTLRAFLGARNATRRLVQPPAATDQVLTPAAQAYLAQQEYDAGLLQQLKRAADEYEPQPYHGRVLCIRSSEEPRGFGLDRVCGWAGLVQGDLRQASVTGDHLTIFMEPGVTALTRHVREAAR